MKVVPKSCIVIIAHTIAARRLRGDLSKLTKLEVNPITLPADAVQALAAIEGYPPLDMDTAQRIAIGASNATRAVTASADESLFAMEPGLYLVELEQLADPE